MIELSGRAAPRRVVGIDFSGAVNAGKKIWIASGPIAGKSVRIERLIPASGLPNGSTERDVALAALVEYIATETDAAIGLDFPFGLPKDFVRESNWVDFVRAFPMRFPDAETLYEIGGPSPRKEPKRQTDKDAKTPFSPIFQFMYRQTWAGIALVLCPLIARDAARVLPMQRPRSDAPIVLEICPASTLKIRSFRRINRYKRSSRECSEARMEILIELVTRGMLERPARDIENIVIGNTEGDALDAIVAAVGAHRALYDPRIAADPDAVAAKEGVVFF